MKIAEKLDKIRRDFEEGDTPREVIDALNANIDKLLSENVADHALQIGDDAPLDNNVVFEKAEPSLNSFMGSEYLILNWFRGNW